jgi:prophage DNA circulation protein
MRSVDCLCAAGLLALLLTGCGVFRFLSHDPTEDLKGTATDVSAEVKESAREYEARLRESGEKLREEIRTAAAGVARIAKSADDLVVIVRDSPAAYGHAVSQRLLEDETLERTLKSVTGLARSSERMATAAEQGPALLVAKIAEMQGELTNAEGVLGQQRDAILSEVRKERAAAMKDLDAYTTKAIQEISGQLSTLLHTAILGSGLLILIILGLPFSAGYVVGRLSRKRSSAH